MCGRYTNSGSQQDLQGAFTEFDLRAPNLQGFRRYNIAPTEQVVAVTAPDGVHRAEMLRWWLVPPWQKELRSKYPMFNARLETIETARSFKDLIASGFRRCLILADGWYEWIKAEDPKDPKVPMHFRVDGGVPFAFAGLWSRAMIDGQEVRSCTIVTRDSSPNHIAAAVHARMPVVLADQDVRSAWLNPSIGAEAVAICEALPADRLTVCPANPAVNRVGIEGPDLLNAPAGSPGT